MNRYLSVPEAATYLNTTVRFARRLVAERRMPFHKIGRHIRFAVSDLDAFVAQGRIEPVGVTGWGEVSALRRPLSAWK